ncbi:MAG: hypothetical protein LBQ43_03885, partial [Holosporales bacterium]|nr:hypothetical protein [Holosporales bacterium]
MFYCPKKHTVSPVNNFLLFALVFFLNIIKGKKPQGATSANAKLGSKGLPFFNIPKIMLLNF